MKCEMIKFEVIVKESFIIIRYTHVKCGKPSLRKKYYFKI